MDSQDFALLPILDALLQEESVSKAARKMGLSAAAMSHALARIRDKWGDPFLVRTGNQMVLTPRALAMRTQVHQLVQLAETTLAAKPDTPATWMRTFHINASDYVLHILGPHIHQKVQQHAPDLTLRFLPNSQGDASALRDGSSDLAVGIYGDLPPELRMRPVLTERFVCVLRQDHPLLTADPQITLQQYTALDHIQIAPRGKAGGYIDDVLADLGYTRKVTRAVPFFSVALAWVAQSDAIATVPARLAGLYASTYNLSILPLPFAVQPYGLGLLWHPKYDDDVAHRWLRQTFVEVAQGCTDEIYPPPRRRLDPQDPNYKRG